jgi:hypothetical protein
VLNQRYVLMALLGRGGFSEVYKAYDLQVGLQGWQVVTCWCNTAKTTSQLPSNWSF